MNHLARPFQRSRQWYGVANFHVSAYCELFRGSSHSCWSRWRGARQRQQPWRAGQAWRGGVQNTALFTWYAVPRWRSSRRAGDVALVLLLWCAYKRSDRVCFCVHVQLASLLAHGRSCVSERLRGCTGTCRWCPSPCIKFRWPGSSLRVRKISACNAGLGPRKWVRGCRKSVRGSSSGADPRVSGQMQYPPRFALWPCG